MLAFIKRFEMDANGKGSYVEIASVQGYTKRVLMNNLCDWWNKNVFLNSISDDMYLIYILENGKHSCLPPYRLSSMDKVESVVFLP